MQKQWNTCGSFIYMIWILMFVIVFTCATTGNSSPLNLLILSRIACIRIDIIICFKIYVYGGGNGRMFKTAICHVCWPLPLVDLILALGVQKDVDMTFGHVHIFNISSETHKQACILCKPVHMHIYPYICLCEFCMLVIWLAHPVPTYLDSVT